jgi:hypothetical protein
MTPAVIHQTGLKTERKWKNYYRNGSVPVEKETGQNGSESSEPDRVKEPCPIEENKGFQHGNGAKA